MQHKTQSVFHLTSLKITSDTTVRDTATASLENKPLIETPGPLDDASPGLGWWQPPAVTCQKSRDFILTERLKKSLEIIH